MERVSVVGAGSVGLAVGARLRRAGLDVLFVVRDGGTARRLAERGIDVVHAASGVAFRAEAGAVAWEDAGPERIGRGPVLVCTRATETPGVAGQLAAVASIASVVSIQNDVDNEAVLAGRLGRVIGAAYRETCTRSGRTRVHVQGAPRIVLGLHPIGRSDEVEALAHAFRSAGYDVGVSERIGEDKWLKWCVNLMSAPNALVRPSDHGTAEFVETKARLLEEARAVLGRAGIVARSCDGRDRSLEDEIAHQRASLAAGTSRRALPLYNSVWSSLRYGLGLEADRYHRRLLDLASRHGVPAPVNARVLEVLLRAAAQRLGPGRLPARDLLPPA